MRRVRASIVTAPLSQEAFERTVSVIVVPEGELSDCGMHALGPNARFWLHTVGMQRYGRPDMEIRDVHILAIDGAASRINGWAFYSLQTPIKPGESLGDRGNVPMTLRASTSEDPYWQDPNANPHGCLRLDVEAVHFACSCDKGTTPPAINEDMPA